MNGVILPRLALLSLAGILVLAAGKGEASDVKPGEKNLPELQIYDQRLMIIHHPKSLT